MGRASRGLRAIWRNLLRPLFTENRKREFYCQLYGTFEPEKTGQLCYDYDEHSPLRDP